MRYSHLYISNIKEDWSFGLNGKVKIDVKGNLNKLNPVELIIKFTYPDGTPLDFRNTNHSFTLRIIE